MIGENGKGVPSPTQVVPPVGKSFHHGKQLSLVDVIVTLCGSEGGRVVCDGMEFRLSPFV